MEEDEAFKRFVHAARGLYQRVKKLDKNEDVRPADHRKLRIIRTNLEELHERYQRNSLGEHDVYDGSRIRDVILASDVFDRYIREKLRGGEAKIECMGDAELIMKVFDRDPRDYTCVDEHIESELQPV